jgi:hypothetical protein
MNAEALGGVKYINTPHGPPLNGALIQLRLQRQAARIDLEHLTAYRQLRGNVSHRKIGE